MYLPNVIRTNAPPYGQRDRGIHTEAGEDAILAGLGVYRVLMSAGLQREEIELDFYLVIADAKCRFILFNMSDPCVASIV